jgi:hypothetical protein
MPLNRRSVASMADRGGSNMRGGPLKLRLLLANSQFLAICITLLGAAIRLTPLAFVDITLPFRSGGLFAEFSRQISAHDYLLPSRIPFYTDGGIPFAYPPLPFYVEAVLLDLFSLPEFVVANLLPPFIAVLTLPSFYFLTRVLGLSVRTRLAALVVFAAMPAAFVEQIESAGLSEAFGSLVLIWLAISLVRAHKRDTAANYGLVGLSWAICVVASPGTAYAAVPTMLIFAVVQLARAGWRPSVRTIGFLGATGVIAVVASSPYWLTVVANHGVEVFVNSFLGVHEGTLGSLHSILKKMAYFKIFQVSRAPYPFLYDVAIFSGAVCALFSHRWALLAWFAALYSIPREGRWMVAMPAALLVGSAASVFSRVLIDLGEAHMNKWGKTAITGGFAFLVGIYVLWNPISTIRGITQSYDRGTLSDTIAAMEWARENTPVESRFITLAPLGEWAPHVTRRTVLNVHQGAEWEPKELEKILRLQESLKNCPNLDCVQVSVAETMGYDEVYLYVNKNRLSELMSASRGEDTVFDLMWENSKIAIGRLSTPEGH